MTTLPTPETLRSRAAEAIDRADSATRVGRDTTDATRILAETQRAVALAAYARELLTIAAQLEPAPSTTAPAETSPPDAHEPEGGDVYEYGGAHYALVWCPDESNVGMSLIGCSPPTGEFSGRASWHVRKDFVRRFCRRVSPPREAT